MDSTSCIDGPGSVRASSFYSTAFARRQRKKSTWHSARRSVGESMVMWALLASSLPTAQAQNCVSLDGSKMCPAFRASSISTNSNLTGLFPFLSSVHNLKTFDSGLASYISGEFASVKYQTLLGCSNFQPNDTTDFYARYTASVLCNAIVQNSISACGLRGNAARPLCAESCAVYAESEEEISASDVCGRSGPGAMAQIRADFTNCALPADSLTQSCIFAAENQPDNCGFGSNMGSLCSYCAASSPNATDSCCVFSDTTTRCKNVKLPIIASSSLQPITMTIYRTSSTSGTPSNTGAAGEAGAEQPELTGGQIAGIVVGAILGALLLLGLVILGCLFYKRRKQSSPPTSVFNQPVTARHIPSMSINDGTRDGERAGLAVVPGARVARMAALEDSDSFDRQRQGHGGVALHGKYSSEEDSPELLSRRGFGPPPTHRGGSLTASSRNAAAAAAAAAETSDSADSSPSSNNEYTSPESNGQSEQLAFFKDYYSQDEIRNGDLVATLWAYEPRAADEFSLERGDMIKVLGIWDDGWATGMRVRQKAEDWRADTKVQRDSGMSTASGSGHPRTADTEPDDIGDVKAFPLVCVCLPQHWRKTIEGESTDASGPPGFGDLP